MALHEIPDDGGRHSPTPECDCGVITRRGVYRGRPRTIFAHTPTDPAPPASAVDDYDETYGGAQ